MPILCQIPGLGLSRGNFAKRPFKQLQHRGQHRANKSWINFEVNIEQNCLNFPTNFDARATRRNCPVRLGKIMSCGCTDLINDEGTSLETLLLLRSHKCCQRRPFDFKLFSNGINLGIHGCRNSSNRPCR